MQVTAYGIVLRALSSDQIEIVRQWRNDPDVSRFMVDQHHITREMQASWFDKVSADPRQAHFMISFRGEDIGLAYLKALNGEGLEEATVIEPGFYLAPGPYRGTAFAFAPAFALNDYCFDVMGAKELRAKVLADNRAALRFNETLGYVRLGQDNQGLEVQSLRPEQYYPVRDNLARFIRFSDKKSKNSL